MQTDRRLRKTPANARIQPSNTQITRRTAPRSPVSSRILLNLLKAADGGSVTLETRGPKAHEARNGGTAPVEAGWLQVCWNADIAKRLHLGKEAEFELVYRLALVAEMRDNRTSNHIRRVSALCGELARRVGLPSVECEIGAQASSLHDLGKIAIPTEILSKPGPLSASEWTLMREHPTIGAQLLAGSKLEVLSIAETIAHTHHERWDGSGYPRGLKGREIPLWGRICALADVYDALLAPRPYKEGCSFETAVDIIRQGRGRHHDPALVDLFLDICSEDPLEGGCGNEPERQSPLSTTSSR